MRDDVWISVGRCVVKIVGLAGVGVRAKMAANGFNCANSFASSSLDF